MNIQRGAAIPAAGEIPRRSGRPRREFLGRQIAADHGGVAHRGQLRAVGVTRDDVRTEVRAGRWKTAGRHTVVIDGFGPEARQWWAVWESGSGAFLDGSAAQVASGMTGFEPTVLDVGVPAPNTAYRHSGVRLHRPRGLPPLAGVGVPRTQLEVATIHAAQWAASDRQMALLVCLPVQQRMVDPSRLLDCWRGVARSPRRSFLEQVIGDVCDGAHSLGELDFGRLCGRYGLPEPARQVVRRVPSGRIYLDAELPGSRLVVEIDGGHHAAALNPVDDALRQNEIAISGRPVLRIPLLGMRLEEDAFMRQVVRAYIVHSAKPRLR